MKKHVPLPTVRISVSTDMASSNANFLEQKNVCMYVCKRKVLAWEKSSTFTGLVWDSKRAAVTSRENTRQS